VAGFFSFGMAFSAHLEWIVAQPFVISAPLPPNRRRLCRTCWSSLPKTATRPCPNIKLSAVKADYDSYIWVVTMNKPNADSQRSKDSKDRLRFEAFSFGSICIDGATYEHDVVIDRGEIRKRKKKPSKKYREKFGHTPLSIEEDIPWKCRRLVIGTGAGALPVMEEVKQEAHRRKVELTIVPTIEAIKALEENPAHTNAILHVTC
jgi:hypothetical protein